MSTGDDCDVILDEHVVDEVKFPRPHTRRFQQGDEKKHSDARSRAEYLSTMSRKLSRHKPEIRRYSFAREEKQ